MVQTLDDNKKRDGRQGGVTGRDSAIQHDASQRSGSRWDDAGMATAEYAVATLAACGFAGLLVTILRGNEVRGLLLGIIRRALALD